MNTFRLICCAVLAAALAHAHVSAPFPTLTIPLGEERTFFIIADVEEENATMYSVKETANPSVARVVSTRNFSRKKFGSWYVRGAEARDDDDHVSLDLQKG